MDSVRSGSEFQREAAARESTKSFSCSMRATINRRCTEQTPPRATRLSVNLQSLGCLRAKPANTTSSDLLASEYAGHSNGSGLGPLRSTGMNSSSTLARDSVILKNIELSVRRFKVQSTCSNNQQTVLRAVSEDVDEVEDLPMLSIVTTRLRATSANLFLENKNSKKSNFSFLNQFQQSVMDFIGHGSNRPSCGGCDVDESEGRGRESHAHTDISPAAAILKRRNPVVTFAAQESDDITEKQAPGLPTHQIITTIGSQKHATDDCRACGFFYKGNCGKGWSCEYCHLCTKADVRRKKKKEKQEYTEAA